MRRFKKLYPGIYQDTQTGKIIHEELEELKKTNEAHKFGEKVDQELEKLGLKIQ